MSLFGVIAARTAPVPRLARHAFIKMSCGRGESDEIIDAWREEAEKLGYSCTGKVYFSTLAEVPGDPEAWCADIYELEAKARARGLRLSGSVECDYRSSIHDRPWERQLNEDFIQELFEDLVAQEPWRDRRELWEQATEEIDRRTV